MPFLREWFSELSTLKSSLRPSTLVWVSWVAPFNSGGTASLVPQLRFEDSEAFLLHVLLESLVAKAAASELVRC